MFTRRRSGEAAEETASTACGGRVQGVVRQHEVAQVIQVLNSFFTSVLDAKSEVHPKLP